MSKEVIYDPLLEIIKYFRDKTEEDIKEKSDKKNSIEDTLKNKIIDGDKTGLEFALSEALKKYTAIEIINSILLEGMKTVGELFGSGKMQLPFVLQSAEVMKTAVSYLEQFMDKIDSDSSKGKMVIATVKGDVHDIGKNLVDIILTNNGYKVINLGIKCPIEKMLEAVEEQKADVLGMSGLLVKSTSIMKENLEIMNERSIDIPVILGGAALTRRFVEGDLKNLYNGEVHYAQDAFDGLKIMDIILNNFSTPVNRKIKNPKNVKISDLPVVKVKDENRKKIEIIEDIPRPPFWGKKILDSISLEEIFAYINESALFKGQWQVKKRNLSDEEYTKIIREEIYPVFKYWKERSIKENLLEPKIVYGYYPCQSDNDDLIIYEPDSKKEILRFAFPRQKSGQHLCISDFFRSKQSGLFDVFSAFFVTIGKAASEFSKTLYDNNKYSDYLYFHGLSVESAEALAEAIHKKIREELNIHQYDSKNIKELFNQGYRGSRYSFGYPACPDLNDQLKLMKLLEPEKIGISLSEEFQLHPEQSVSAIIVHHPNAKYFKA